MLCILAIESIINLNLILEKNGDIILSKYPKMGKRYRFLDRLKGKGIGTSKLQYLNGIEVFDEIQKLNQDTAFVNFEPTTEGFILHFNKTNRVRAFGIPFKQIQKIVISRVKQKPKKSIFEAKTAHLSIKTGSNLININFPDEKTKKLILFFETYLLQNQLVIL